jgi:hypothetical protein
MILPKSLLIIVLNYIAMPEANQVPAQLPPALCNEIQVSWSKTDTSRGENNGSISFEFSGDRAEYAVYLLTPAGTTKLKATEISIRNLKKGKHSVVITGEKEGSNYCQKFFEVVIN